MQEETRWVSDGTCMLVEWRKMEGGERRKEEKTDDDAGGEVRVMVL